jgi:hypothetical protein
MRPKTACLSGEGGAAETLAGQGKAETGGVKKGRASGRCNAGVLIVWVLRISGHEWQVMAGESSLDLFD